MAVYKPHGHMYIHLQEREREGGRGREGDMYIHLPQ